MSTLTFGEFNNTYQDVVGTVLKYWTPKMQEELSKHNIGWANSSIDFRQYFKCSAIRFYKAYRAFFLQGGQSLCDIGGFWGIFTITLKRLGVEDIYMTESLQYYSNAFDDLFGYIREKGVNIIDFDPFMEHAVLPGRFDMVTAMAVIEHYPHSLKTFMSNLTAMLKDNGRLYIEVPNIAYWPKRIQMLKGKTPLVSISDIYNSDTPFIGHHHEFAISELRDLAKLSGLNVMAEHFYNYSIHASLTRIIRNPIQFLAMLLLKDSRECLAILCRLKDFE